MNPLPAWRRTRRATSAPCPCCGARTSPGQHPHPCIEPTALEREAPHAPGCPLLPRKCPRLALVPLALAVLPALPMGCQGTTAAGDPSRAPGLDNGTVSRLELPAWRAESA